MRPEETQLSEVGDDSFIRVKKLLLANETELEMLRGS